MRIRPVDRGKAKDYLKRAGECRNSMNRSFEEGEWNASVINAVHAAISAVDAFCIWERGLRHAGERHGDAVRFFLEINPQDAGIRKAVRHLETLLNIKTDAEYGERLMGEDNAVLSKKHAERLLDFVQSRMQL